MSKSLIVITGLKRSGKDTMADYLVKEHGYIKAQPFACFKKALGEWFCFSSEQMDGKLKEVVDPRWGISPRTLFQDFGTDLMKSCLCDLEPEYEKVTGNKLWAKVFREWYLKQPDGKYVVSDYRFPEEYDCIKDLENITFVRVENNRCKNTDMHASEAGISKLYVDYYIDNHSSFENYYSLIDRLVEYIEN